MLTLLEEVANRGTATRLRNDTYRIYSQVAAKTGTTQNQSDGWFMGITPNLVAGVWTGAEDRSTHFDGLSLGQGANMALPIWALFMNKVYQDSTLGILPSDKFEEPLGFNPKFDCKDVVDQNKNKEDKDTEEFMD